jgi:hypothetical protein
MSAPLALAAIKARVEAASVGPWTAHPDGLVWAPRLGDPVSASTEPADAEFIAAARQDVPALIAEVERLRAQLAAPAGPADDDRVWLIGTPGAHMHRLPRTEICNWPLPHEGVTVLASEAIEGWQATPCPRCWPVTS